MMERADIPREYKWDLSVIYPTEEDFERALAECAAEAAEFSRHDALMCLGAEELLAAVSELAAVEAKLDKLAVYTNLAFNLDTSDTVAQAKKSRVRDVAVRLGEAAWFFAPRLLSLGEQRLEEYIASLPALESYRRQLEKIMRRRAHTLTDECERLYSEMEDCLHLHSNLRSIFANSDLRHGKTLMEDGGRRELTEAAYLPLMSSHTRAVRRSAFKTMYKTYASFKNTFAAMYYNYVKEACTLARVRGYESSRAASTFRDEITPEIYDNLIENVTKSLPTLFKYYDLKREVLGLSRLHMYDIYAPLVDDADEKYSYDEARREVAALGEVFGEEYARVLREGLYVRGWVDVYPTRGKRSGAFSSGCSSTEPYILLNFGGTFDDVSTLAHEAGHSMHSYFSRKHNEPHNADYTLFVAEVASTVNELLLMRKRIRESTSRRERLYLLNQLMELYKSTLFRQTMLAEFERDAHEACRQGKPLTADLLCSSYYSLVKKYFGGSVVCDREIELEWMRIPHFYMNFYVYKYATCISAASMIVERIEREGNAYINKYIDFLKCGDSRSPLESLLVAEVDMASADVVRPAIAAFEAAINEFKITMEEKK